MRKVSIADGIILRKVLIIGIYISHVEPHVVSLDGLCWPYVVWSNSQSSLADQCACLVLYPIHCSTIVHPSVTWQSRNGRVSGHNRGLWMATAEHLDSCHCTPIPIHLKLLRMAVRHELITHHYLSAFHKIPQVRFTKRQTLILKSARPICEEG